MRQLGDEVLGIVAYPLELKGQQMIQLMMLRHLHQYLRSQ
jgi:hypothetical protein